MKELIDDPKLNSGNWISTDLHHRCIYRGDCLGNSVMAWAPVGEVLGDPFTGVDDGINRRRRGLRGRGLRGCGGGKRSGGKSREINGAEIPVARRQPHVTGFMFEVNGSNLGRRRVDSDSVVLVWTEKKRNGGINN